MLPCGGLYGPFQKHRVITRQYRVIDVQEVDFELRRRKFGGCCVGRDALCLTIGINVVEEGFDFPEIIRVINLRAWLRPTTWPSPGTG